MKYIFTITQTNDKEWTNHVTAYANMETAISHYQRIVFNSTGKEITKKEIHGELTEVGESYSFTTYIDSFGRKWGVELKETTVQNDNNYNK
jgi:hypothetical protein